MDVTDKDVIAKAQVAFFQGQQKEGATAASAYLDAINAIAPQSGGQSLNTPEGIKAAYHAYEKSGGKEGIPYNEAFELLKKLKQGGK